MTKTKKEDEVSPAPDYTEYDVKDGDCGNYLITKSVFLKVKDGPGVPLTVGKIARLSSKTAKLFFYECKAAIPVGMKDGQLYQVTRNHRITEAEGLYQELKPGTMVRLSVDEAVNLLREGKIKLPDEEGCE